MERLPYNSFRIILHMAVNDLFFLAGEYVLHVNCLYRKSGLPDKFT